VVWTAHDLGVDISKIGEAGRRKELLKLYHPVREDKCVIIEGESPEEAARNLVLRLLEAKILQEL